MKNVIKDLRIQCDKYARDAKGDYIKGGQMKGDITFANKLGKIELEVDDNLCNAIIQLALGNIANTCNQQIKDLNQSFQDHVKSTGDSTSKLLKLLSNET